MKYTDEELDESIKTRHGNKLYKMYLEKTPEYQALMRELEGNMLDLVAEIKANMKKKLEPINDRLNKWKLERDK